MNMNFVIALMATSFLEQTIVTLVRVTTSYRAVELGISVVGIGIIAAAFSILPIAMAVALGRYIDKGNDARAVWYGAALMMVGCAGFPVAGLRRPVHDRHRQRGGAGFDRRLHAAAGRSARHLG